MTFSENLDEFLETDDFATPVVYTPGGGSPKNINAIFDNDFYLSDGAENGTESSQPRLMVKSADIVGIVEGDSMTLQAVNYKVIREEPDGTGISTIILQKA